jgi:hypothetical protein
MNEIGVIKRCLNVLQVKTEYKVHEASRYSSESGKTDATVADIPSSVDVLEEDVSENPDLCIMDQLCSH